MWRCWGTIVRLVNSYVINNNDVDSTTNRPNNNDSSLREISGATLCMQSQKIIYNVYKYVRDDKW